MIFAWLRGQKNEAFKVCLVEYYKMVLRGVVKSQWLQRPYSAAPYCSQLVRDRLYISFGLWVCFKRFYIHMGVFLKSLCPSLISRDRTQ